MIYFEKIFSKEECDLIISYSKNTKTDLNDLIDLDHSGQKILEGNRMIGGDTSYYIHHIINTTETEWIFDKILNWFSNISGIKLNSEKYKLDKCMLLNYLEGDKFQRHIDISDGFEERRWNLGIQLNDGYEGGEYVCYDINEKEIIFPKEIGTAIAYHISIPHEIKEIRKGNRWSMVLSIPKMFLNEKKSFL
jgi:hypothetical protein